MLKRFKTWFCKHFIKSKYVHSLDVTNGKDYTCEVDGYRGKNGIIHIAGLRLYDKIWVLIRLEDIMEEYNFFEKAGFDKKTSIKLIETCNKYRVGYDSLLSIMSQYKINNNLETIEQFLKK